MPSDFPQKRNQPKRKKVLFLCTGNSCRSQMAEALVNDRLGETWQAYSAGTQPSGFVHPKALAVLEEIGIRHKGYSKDVSVARDIPFDLVVTVCDDAAENCPIWLGIGKKIHVGFPDPAKAVGSDEEITGVFRKVRDDMEKQIIPLLSQK
jgi:arsenate reductase